MKHPTCKDCVHFCWVNWKWRCTANLPRYKTINLRRLRFTAKKCSQFIHFNHKFQ